MSKQTEPTPTEPRQEITIGVTNDGLLFIAISKGSQGSSARLDWNAATRLKAVFDDAMTHLPKPEQN